MMVNDFFFVLQSQGDGAQLNYMSASVFHRNPKTYIIPKESDHVT